MSGGNSSNNRNGGGDGDGEGWGSKLFKVAGAAVAAAAAAGGIYALVTASASGNSEPEVPFGAGRVRKEADDPWSHHHEVPSQIGWKKPDNGWVKLNVDGSRVHELPLLPPSAGCGGVLRDESGTWLHGFAQKLDPSCDVHETEIWGIFTGLKLAWDRGVKKLLVESDCDSAVDLVKNGCKSNHPQFDIITRTRQLLYREWQVRLTSIHRKANRVADKLAYEAHNLVSGDLRQFPSPPDNCITLLMEDAQGVSF